MKPRALRAPREVGDRIADRKRQVQRLIPVLQVRQAGRTAPRLSDRGRRLPPCQRRMMTKVNRWSNPRLHCDSASRRPARDKAQPVARIDRHACAHRAQPPSWPRQRQVQRASPGHVNSATKTVSHSAKGSIRITTSHPTATALPPSEIRLRSTAKPGDKTQTGTRPQMPRHIRPAPGKPARLLTIRPRQGQARHLAGIRAHRAPRRRPARDCRRRMSSSSPGRGSHGNGVSKSGPRAIAVKVRQGATRNSSPAVMPDCRPVQRRSSRVQRRGRPPPAARIAPPFTKMPAGHRAPDRPAITPRSSARPRRRPING